ncbi:hypothetical protein Tco_1017592 [Tanacetum coccineum]|uniref:Uncharacterized protein n=1 Tax=Tanacetum coccineum TaxID=301880 RepID=A0ABQ5FUH7_9ASTR
MGKRKLNEKNSLILNLKVFLKLKRSLSNLLRDEEMARKVQEDSETKEEVKKLAEEEATKAALSNEYDFIQARMEVDRLLANLKKRLKKKVAKETPKTEDTAKVPAKVDVTEQGTRDSEIMEKKSFISKLDKVSSPEGDYLVIHRANGNFRYSKITLEGFELILWGDLKIMRVLNSPCFMVKSWLVQDQTVLGKDYSNLLIADSLLKTIWFINAPCYGNEALASPKSKGIWEMITSQLQGKLWLYDEVRTRLCLFCHHQIGEDCWDS